MTERGTPERWRHSKAEIRSIEIKAGAGKATVDVIADAEAHLFDSLLAKGLINQAQADVGLWLESLRLASGLEPRQVGSYNPLGHGSETTEQQAENRAQFNKAVSVTGKHAKAVLAAIEGSLKPSDLDSLRDGLSALARWRDGTTSC